MVNQELKLALVCILVYIPTSSTRSIPKGTYMNDRQRHAATEHRGSNVVNPDSVESLHSNEIIGQDGRHWNIIAEDDHSEANQGLKADHDEANHGEAKDVEAYYDEAHHDEADQGGSTHGDADYSEADHGDTEELEDGYRVSSSLGTRSKRDAALILYSIQRIPEENATTINEALNRPFPTSEIVAQIPTNNYIPMVDIKWGNLYDIHRIPSNIPTIECDDCKNTLCHREGGICRQIYQVTQVLQGYFSEIQDDFVYREETLDIPVACTCYKPKI